MKDFGFEIRTKGLKKHCNTNKSNKIIEHYFLQIINFENMLVESCSGTQFQSSFFFRKDFVIYRSELENYKNIEL